MLILSICAFFPEIQCCIANARGHRSAKPMRIDSFMKLISPFGILESSRTGLMALPRSPLHGANEDVEKLADDIVDASSLPPG